MMRPNLLFLRRPNIFFSQIRDVRVRPNILITNDQFRLSVGMKDYCKEDIKVKVRSNYVMIEGYSEKKFKEGHVVRRLARKFKLPVDCQVDSMKSVMSSDGILTITVKRRKQPNDFVCEKIIPIQCPGESASDKQCPNAPDDGKNT